MTFVLTEIFGDTSSPFYAHIIGDGVPIVKSFRICRMKGTCAIEYIMHICTKTFDFYQGVQ
jgi:hypothetical protein